MKKLLLLTRLLLIKCTGQSIKETFYETPLSEVTTITKFYELEGVKFFAVLGSDGLVRTIFDACEIYGGDKGYNQEGSDVIYNNCNSIGTKNLGSGCWLSYLVKNKYVLISKSNLIRKGYFQ